MRILSGIHGKLIPLTLIAGLIIWLFYKWVPALPVPGIETDTVYALGILAVLLVLLGLAYSLRKRVERGIPGRLDVWLWAHVYLGVLALFIVALHAEFRFGWNYNTLAFVLLALVIITGIAGRYIYSYLPGKILREQEDVIVRLDETNNALNELMAGKSRTFQKIIGSRLNVPSPLSPDDEYWDEVRTKVNIVPEDERKDFVSATDLLVYRAELESQSIGRLKYGPVFKGWLTVHIIFTVGLIILIPVHVLDETFKMFSVKASDFGSPQECRQCHQRQYDEWIGSMHAYGQVSPVFLAFNDRVKHTGLGPFCVQCHTPIGISIGEEALTPNEERAEISLMGVQCDACHVIDRDHGLVSGRFPLSPGRTKYGPFGTGREGDPKGVRNSAHRSVQADFIQSSEFCGQCHDVVDGKGLRIEEAFTEWKESVYAEKGITCQDCHMRALPGIAGQEKIMGPAAIVMGMELPERPLSDHSFIGPDNHLIDTFPYPDNPEENARIQRIYLEKKQFLLENCAEIEIIAPDSVPSSSEMKVEVKITNTGAGHGIPTGFTAERQVWIEITVRDANGKVLFISGDLDENKDLRNNHSEAVKNGRVPPDEWLLNLQSKFIRRTPEGVDEELLLPTLAFDVEKNNIMPYESKSGFYPVNVTGDVKGPVTVEAKLLYRNLPPYLLDFLGVGELKDRLVINQMAAATKTIEID